jgi:hypothetical protein
MNVGIGWLLVAVGFASGGLMGILAQRESWLGGYDSRPRRLVRLGHIALVALGALNVLWPVTSTAQRVSPLIPVIQNCFLVGGVTMGPVCFLTAWRWPCRFLFPIPAVSLIAGAVLAAWENFS